MAKGARTHNGDDIYQSVVILEQNVQTIAKRQEEDARSVREEMRGIRGDIKTISDTFTAMRQTNWPVVISMIIGVLMFLAVMVGGSWVIIKLQTDNAIAHAIGDFSSTRNDRLAPLEANAKVIEAKLVEVETQIAKNYSERSIQNTGFERRFIEHQNALHNLGAVIPNMPEQPYYQPQPVPSNSSNHTP